MALVLGLSLGSAAPGKLSLPINVLLCITRIDVPVPSKGMPLVKMRMFCSIHASSSTSRPWIQRSSSFGSILCGQGVPWAMGSYSCRVYQIRLTEADGIMRADCCLSAVVWLLAGQQ